MDNLLPLFPVEPTEILLSLEPTYWEQIVAGSKRVEYRRAFRSEATRAFILTSGPGSSLVGYLELSEPLVGSPERVSAYAESVRPGHGSAVYDYLRTARKGYAIPITSAYQGETRSLALLREAVQDVSVPQLYQLLSRRKRLSDYIHAWMATCKRVW